MRKGLKKRWSELLLRYVLRVPPDWIVPLAEPLRKGMPMATLYSEPLWRGERFARQLSAVLRMYWRPSTDRAQQVADEIFAADIFGRPEDYGDKLLDLATWHYQQPSLVDLLSPEDDQKAYSLQVFTQATRQRFKDLHFSRLRLQLAVRTPLICTLAFPMVIKVPVLAIRYYLDIDYFHAFAAIRKSGHSQADGLIAYLYEAAFVQQKIAIGFHEFLRLVRHARLNKDKAVLTKAEVDAIREIDTIVSLLKGSLEKIIALLGLTHGITNLADQKTHGQKIALLKKKLPAETLALEYWQWIEEFIRPENLDALNNLRTGLLHKRGIASLQPHSYAGKAGTETPFEEIYAPLHEQHAKNTVVFLCTLAILTDQLVRIDPPSKEEQLAFFLFLQQVSPVPGPFLSADPPPPSS